eukprot:8478962-Pyramimonas_sp.AAC.1
MSARDQQMRPPPPPFWASRARSVTQAVPEQAQAPITVPPRLLGRRGRHRQWRLTCAASKGGSEKQKAFSEGGRTFQKPSCLLRSSLRLRGRL